jgi:cell division protein FtsA
MRVASALKVMGLDLGTTKVSALIAEIDRNGRPIIIGVGTERCEGIRKGVIVDIEKTVSAIEGAVQAAEIMSEFCPKSAFVSISGDHIRGINSTGVVAVARPDKEIGEHDVERVVGAAKAIAVPNDRRILHVIPQEFMVDDQGGIDLPVGMSGIRLEVKAHIITCSSTCAQNIVKSVKRAGLDIDALVLQSLATGNAVLTQEERELGVAVIDVGGGTTDVTVFKDGAIRHTSVVALGGNHVTNDLVIGLRTPFGQAEDIKISHGCARRPDGDGETIDVRGVKGRRSRQVSKRVIAQIMGPRLEEILYLAKGELTRSEYYEVLGAGVVLTGGTSLISGMEELAEDVLSMPARLGMPEDVGGLMEYVKDPRMSTGVGLLHHAGYMLVKGGVSAIERPAKLGNVFGKVKRWVSAAF